MSFAIENNLKISWQLVSQFVSWDFCRYTCEKNDSEETESDVLTFLRNMIVERTEKAATDITKHEIVAKFIMETKTIRNISRMPCIIALADTVKKLCPELQKAITDLVNHLENFLEVLEYNEDSEKAEILLGRIAYAVNDFSKVACTKLPAPDLLQVVQAWLSLDSQSQKRKPKYPQNPALYKRVLNRLQQEIQRFEIESIAQALYDDDIFKKVMYKSEGDSQNVSISSSQIPVESSLPDSLQLSGRFQLNNLQQVHDPIIDNSLSLHSQPLESEKSVYPPIKLLSQNPTDHLFLDSPDERQIAEHIDQLGSLTEAEAFLFENPNPTPLFTTLNKGPTLNFDSPSKSNFPKRPFRSESFSLVNTEPVVIKIKPSNYIDLRSEESDVEYPTQRPAKLTKVAKKNKLFTSSQNGFNEHSDSEDTSDCDKNAEYRFLTPTLYKKNNNQVQPEKNVVYLSDQESFNSSIVTTFVDSQKNDPTFNSNKRHPIVPVTSSPVKLKKSKTPKKRKRKNTAKKTNTTKRTTRQTTLQEYTASRPAVSTPNNSNLDFKKNVSRKKKYKLFNTDAEPPLPNVTPSYLVRKRKPSKDIAHPLGNKRHCTECSMTFRTPSELKKHVFIFHTNDDFSD